MIRQSFFLFFVFATVGRHSFFRRCSGQGNQHELRRESIFSAMKGVAITTHIYKTFLVSSALECSLRCLSDNNCLSVNYQEEGGRKHICELSAQSTESDEQRWLEQRNGYMYLKPISTYHACLAHECKNSATCIPANTPQGYRCECHSSTTGIYCESWTDNSYSISSCSDILNKTSHRQDKAYTLTVDSKQTDVYCHMSSICRSGGWTLVMKTDGSKDTFAHRSPYWSNKETFNPEAGKTGLDRNETKLSTYWSVSFKKLCLGLRVGNELNWISLSYPATSLYDVIADGRFRSVSAGRYAWLSLITGSSFQNNCNQEGFNNGRRVRIGMLGNQENDCRTPDSFIGIGYAGTPTSGSTCRNTCNNGIKSITAFGYIFVK